MIQFTYQFCAETPMFNRVKRELNLIVQKPQSSAEQQQQAALEQQAAAPQEGAEQA
jgi:hypothetical protein